MRLAIIVLMAFLAFTLPSGAQAPILPSLDLSPEDVLSIQLRALSEAENKPDTNSGIARVWAFAHPSNRVITGPLPRFTLMLQSPSYRALIGHRSHHMKQVSLTTDKAHYAVKIQSSSGADFGYSWHIGKVSSGRYKGMWMTTSVALVGKLGQSL
jgi:hypothetical protein